MTHEDDLFRRLLAGMNGLNGTLLAGVSGGADSVALLRLLAALRDKGQICLHAVHVHHGLRGHDADEDEAFVRALCAELSVPLRCLRLSPPATPGEDWARTARYACFRQEMTRLDADALVLAHHRDDQAETLLLHLLRGSGLTGLCGMAPVSELNGMTVLRPLLAYPRAELQQLLRTLGQTWREDGSNQDPRYLRNALRLQLLPLLEQLAPGASARLAQTASLLQADEAALDTLARQALAGGGEGYLPLETLRPLPEALRRRTLRLWWTRCGAPRAERSLSAAQTLALSALIDAPAGNKCNLPSGWHGCRGHTHLHLLAPDTPPAPDVSGLIALSGSQGNAGDGLTCQELPRALYLQCEWRTRRCGDWIRPFGQAGRQSLQDYLVNRGVDAPFRDRIPLLCRGSEVLVCAGVGTGDVPRWDPQQDNLRLQVTGPMPWLRRQHTGG